LNRSLITPTYLQSKLTFIPDHYGKKASMKSFPGGQSIQRKGESSAINSNHRSSKLIYPQPRRGLWRVQIREYLIAAFQNLQVLLKYGAPLTRGLAFKLDQVKRPLAKAIEPVLDGMKELLIPNHIRIMLLRFVSFGYIKSGNLRLQIL
jgi:hypothetical protein